MTQRDQNDWIPLRPTYWYVWFPLVVGGTLGISGFLAGFLLPIALNPSANQGPLMGIFITGPFSCVGGCLFGLLIGRMWPNRRRALSAFFTILVLQVGGIAFVCLPENKSLGLVAEIEVVQCEAPDGLIPGQIKEWKQRVQRMSWQTPRANWEPEALELPKTDPGVVLTVRVKNRCRIKEGQKPWNKGKVWAKVLKPKNKPRTYVLSGAVCGDPGTSGSGTFLLSRKNSKSWPPDNLPQFLGMRVLQPVPAPWQDLIAEQNE